MPPTLAGGFFSTSTTWEAPKYPSCSNSDYCIGGDGCGANLTAGSVSIYRQKMHERGFPALSLHVLGLMQHQLTIRSCLFIHRIHNGSMGCLPRNRIFGRKKDELFLLLFFFAFSFSIYCFANIIVS